MPLDLMEVTQAQAPVAQSTPAPAPNFTAPGEADLRPSDINSNDPLIHLGLVDPAGRALPTADWQPAQSQTSQLQPQAQAPSAQQVAQTTQPTQPTQPAAAPSGLVDYSAGQTFQQTVAVLQAQAAAAYDRAIAQGADPRQAEAMIGAKLEAEIAKAEAQSVRAAAAPTVKAQVANHIASTLGNGLVRPEDLMVYDSPKAMEAAASQLATARRAANYQQRRAAGVDRAEGASSPAGINPAVANLSPAKLIELGIRRGQY